MKYRTSLALIALALTACRGQSDDSSRRSRGPRPNVVLISVDTLRADRTSLYGYERATTPALSALGQTGTVFERAYALSSWTLPSMSMLMSGVIKPLSDHAILPNHVPLSEALQGAGYRTAGFVANLLLSPDLGYDRGLDHIERASPHDPWKWTAEDIVDASLAWLESSDASEQPFFLWLHPVDPHAPYSPEADSRFEGPPPGDAAFRTQAEAALGEQFAAGMSRADPALLTDADWARVQDMQNRYDSDIQQFDRGLQRLVERLRERGDYENTIFVVTSDHGEGLSQRAFNADEEASGAVYPALYNGHGGQLFEEQVHVPLVFHGPGVPQGRRITDPVDLVDVLPTILALADVAVAYNYPGDPLIQDSEISTRPRGLADPIISLCTRIVSITVDGRWRLHLPREYRLDRLPEKRARIAPDLLAAWDRLVQPQLFDLRNDPHELSPIDDEAKRAELTQVFFDWAERYAPNGEHQTTMDESMFLRLHELGYGGESEHIKQFVEDLKARRK